MRGQLDFAIFNIQYSIMVSEGKGCALIFGGFITIIPMLIIFAVVINNSRTNRVLSQFQQVEKVLKQDGLQYSILNSSKTVEHGIGSADDCLYSASRVYEVSNSDKDLSVSMTKLEKLKLPPLKPRADGYFNAVSTHLSNDKLKVEIYDGPWESIWAMLDYRCG